MMLGDSDEVILYLGYLSLSPFTTAFTIISYKIHSKIVSLTSYHFSHIISYHSISSPAKSNVINTNKRQPKTIHTVTYIKKLSESINDFN